MDRTSIIVLVVCFILMLLWYPMVVSRLYPPKPLPHSTNAPTATVLGTNGVPPATQATQSASTAANIASAVDLDIPEREIVLSNDVASYTFTSRGGGLKEIALLRYPETVSSRRQLNKLSDRVATLNSFTPLPTLDILDEALRGDGSFDLSQTDRGIRAQKSFTNGLTLTKDFELSSNYLVIAKLKIENRSGAALKLPPQEWVVGTATPIGPRDDGSVVGVMWYNGSKSQDVAGAGYFSTHGFACMPRSAPEEYKGGASNVVWAAVHNQFFALAVMPTNPALAITVRRIELPKATGEDALLAGTNIQRGFEALLSFPSITVSSTQPYEQTVFIYAGPKEYQTVAKISDSFNNNLDQIMQFGSWYGFVSKGLLLAMNWLHETLKLSYGLAIIAITLIIKLIFWPITAANTRSSKKMQTLQPQVAAIKDKYKDDALKTHQKTMELYKKHKVSPMGSCLPMMVQIPVFFGFLAMIRSAIELRGAHFLWAGDLTKPDTLFIIPGLSFIPFISIPGVGLPFNLLPIIMGATMLWQARLTPPAPGMDPSQQAIMKYLPLIFLVGLYNFSAAMTIYWTTNNILTIIQTKLTRAKNDTAASAVAKAPALTPPQKKQK
jgi:YidC/Oxa1 family membrane protein insertase